MIEQLPAGWQAILDAEIHKPSFADLAQFVDRERSAYTVYPPEHDVFNAFHLTPYDAVKVLLLGQDPYHGEGQAHGLCFSVRSGLKQPPSLVNVFKELRSDLGCPLPKAGNLESWARQGVLLLNAALTVRAHEPNSHKGRGWEEFTDAVIRVLNRREQPVVFLLWGAYSQKKCALIDAPPHVIIAAAHPSPLSANKFFGSKPFSRVNAALAELGETPVDWRLKDV